MRILRRPALAASWTSPLSPQHPQRLRIVLIPSRGSPSGTISSGISTRAYSSLAEERSRDDNTQQTENANNEITNKRLPNIPRLPFRFETGIGVFAKRPPRPFPPPFLSPPSQSFSDALSTHRAVVDGQPIRGQTNGDDALYASEFFICANDGVGAWATRPRGHAGLWARLILHFWSSAIEDDLIRAGAPAKGETGAEPQPVTSLSTAYKKTLEATTAHDWQGTTTACGAQLHYKTPGAPDEQPVPLLYVTNVGDCQVMVVRPSEKAIVFKTKEQWHWFDCPRQLGTNSPDTPEDNAVIDRVELQVGDVVLAMSDGVIDNLWSHEIVEIISTSIENWEKATAPDSNDSRRGGRNGGMHQAAQDLVAAAKTIALDPYAESPFMEHAIEEGLASEGGKMDDISVVAALCIENS